LRQGYLRGYVMEHVGEPGAVLIVDETGDLKKGDATAGARLLAAQSVRGRGPYR
jgi:SRSO17 transposase